MIAASTLISTGSKAANTLAYTTAVFGLLVWVAKPTVSTFRAEPVADPALSSNGNGALANWEIRTPR